MDNFARLYDVEGTLPPTLLPTISSGVGNIMEDNPAVRYPDRVIIQRRETPSVLASFPSLKREGKELKVRLIQYRKTKPMLDIREWINNGEQAGFSNKGIVLTLEQMQILEANLPQIMQAFQDA